MLKRKRRTRKFEKTYNLMSIPARSSYSTEHLRSSSNSELVHST